MDERSATKALLIPCLSLFLHKVTHVGGGVEEKKEYTLSKKKMLEKFFSKLWEMPQFPLG